MAEFKWCGYNWSCKMDGGRIIHPNYPHAWYSDEEDVLEINDNGEISLSYRTNPRDIKHWDGKIYHPTVERALMRSREHFDYGTFSCEAKMPKGLNLCCAFWLSGSKNWPPEIDIVESWSEDNNYSWRTTNHFPWILPSWRTTNNVHYNNDKILHEHLGSKNIMKCDQPLSPTDNWVKYEVEWAPDKITFKANGVVTKTVGKKYAKMLTENLKKPDAGYLMDVIFDINVDDPAVIKNHLDSPFMIRNFKYEPLKK